MPRDPAPAGEVMPQTHAMPCRTEREKSRIKALTWDSKEPPEEPPEGTEPSTYALRVRTAAAKRLLPALMAHLSALRALHDLGERRKGFHEGFHAAHPGATRSCLVSVAENGEIELAEAIRVGDHVDFGDLVICDGEAEYQEQPAAAAITSPTAPFTSAGWVNRARAEEASAPLATA